MQCSGPTGPMTAVTAVIVAVAHDRIIGQFPGLQADHFINTVFLLTGGIMLIAAILRLGKFVTYVPNVVVSGFMNGIAIIIWTDQVKKLFGFGGKTAFTGPMSINCIVALASMALVFVLPSFFKKILPRYARLFSATLLTIVGMTAVSYVLRLPIEHVALAGNLRSWSDLTTLIASQWPTDWSTPVLLSALPFALQLGILGYLDTLLTSLVIDKMTGEKTKQNKELMAQGLSIAAIATLGGIPGAQATIRSVLIVKEKATMRLAGVLVGIFALLEMILLQDMINLIPQAVFSGVLFKVGYDVFDWLPLRLYLKELSHHWHATLHHFFSRHSDESIFITNTEILLIAGTTAVTIFWDLNIAVGLFTAVFYLINRVFLRGSPLRDLQPVTETEGMRDEP